MPKIERIILIDADVVSHFIIAGSITKLTTIFSYKIKILDKVYRELERFPKRKIEVDNLLNFRLIEMIPFPEDRSDIKKEYYYIKKNLFKGDGEAACLAYVRFSKDIIASSNLKDIRHYCELHSLNYLTTMDFLCEAVKKGVMDEDECDAFIGKVILAKGKLPVNKLKDYRCR